MVAGWVWLASVCEEELVSAAAELLPSCVVVVVDVASELVEPLPAVAPVVGVVADTVVVGVVVTVAEASLFSPVWVPDVAVVCCESDCWVAELAVACSVEDAAWVAVAASVAVDAPADSAASAGKGAAHSVAERMIDAAAPLKKVDGLIAVQSRFATGGAARHPWLEKWFWFHIILAPGSDAWTSFQTRWMRPASECTGEKDEA
jgi:hypothetical protein